MSGHFTTQIPMDVIDEILVRLPDKSLMRFKCVSKQWLSLISSHRFALRYLSLAKDPNFTSFSLFFDCEFITPLSVGLDGSVKFGPSIYLPLPDDDNGVGCPAVVSAGFGIYCVFQNCSGAFQLWNPTTGECISVPPPPLRDEGVFKSINFGKVDCEDGVFSYKVGLVTGTSGNKGFGGPLIQSLELYSSKTKTWKVIPNVLYGDICNNGDVACVNLNGKAHWFTYWEALSEDFDNITTFDYGNEVLGSIPISLAQEIGRYDMSKGILTLWDESFLCLVLFLEKDENAFLDIWIMREYGVQDSWSKEFTVGPICKDAQVLGLSSKIHGIFLWEEEACPCSLKLYDFRSSTSKEIRLPDEFDDELWIMDHVESIISVSM